MSNKINFEGTIDRIEDNIGVILLGTGEEIKIPTEFLPFDADEGSLVKITIKAVNQESLISDKEDTKETIDELDEADYQEEMFRED